MNTALASAHTTPVRVGFEFDALTLERWLTDNVPSFAGPLAIEQFRGGQSNPTYLLSTPQARYVLRRKPAGKLLRGAHAIEREAEVMAALGGRSRYPVPKVYALCTSEAVIGSAFYVMEFVDGRIFWDAALPDVPEDERARLFDAMNDAIARLHGISPAAAGLDTFGRPERYVARQLARWTRQYRAEAEAGRDANMDRLIEWLDANVPQDAGTSVVHGDFRIDNIIFDQREPRVAAVLDWALSTLGDPLADFVNHAIMYRMPKHIVAGLLGADLAALGIPDEHAYIATYCRRTGRDVIPDYDFYIAFAFFRMAAIFHGIRGRFIRGTAASAEAGERAQYFPELARLGARAAGLL